MLSYPTELYSELYEYFVFILRLFIFSVHTHTINSPTPISEASDWLDATHPFKLTTEERREEKHKLVSIFFLLLTGHKSQVTYLKMDFKAITKVQPAIIFSRYRLDFPSEWGRRTEVDDIDEDTPN